MNENDHSHPNCERTATGILHVCQEPSGQPCVEDGCDKPAGTWWGPLWCPDHDVERLDRISRNLKSMVASLESRAVSS